MVFGIAERTGFLGETDEDGLAERLFLSDPAIIEIVGNMAGQ
jgi:hypothetical protein